MSTVTIVGGGVIGTMHAWFALARGHRVRQIERDLEARSASVRNFGLVWVSGRRDGTELQLALRARELWAEIGAVVPGVGFRPHGSLTVALTDGELDVMSSYAATPAAADRDTVLLDPDEVRRAEPAVRGPVVGALHCRRDAIVEPRVLLPSLRDAMAATGRYEHVPGRHVVAHDGAVAIDHLGDRHEADLLVVCPGATHDGLLADRLATAPVRRRRLQMMQTAPTDLRLTSSIADAESLRYYPAYEHLDLAPLGDRSAVAARHDLQLLLVQRLDGSLTIGDTHDDDEPFPFDVDEEPYEHLAERAATILGAPLPPVLRRWAGVYSVLHPDTDPSIVYHHDEVEPGVVLVTGAGGRGMTLSPAIAERTWEAL
ncbi:MAG: TIGR03364 family FAD-dependent oxidoreductase [Ilumatobacteraceae bacterium]|nr:TIGR03364 family FAD-dependent oxidoreductase [Ilumatobacteraceae bacterium]